MATFQGVFFLLLGLGLLGVAWQSLHKGWLPCGPNGLRGTLRVQRSDNPLFYWGLFVGYGLAGLWLAIFALRLLVGIAEPLPLN